jgi:hypothetical protein
MPHLPFRDRAVLDLRKLSDYCLDPAHPRGRHKARVFRAALGIGRDDAGWLRDVLLAAVKEGEGHELVNDAFGTRWRLDVRVGRHGKQTVIRSLWMLRPGEDVLRFVTCWVL